MTLTLHAVRFGIVAGTSLSEILANSQIYRLTVHTFYLGLGPSGLLWKPLLRRVTLFHSYLPLSSMGN